MRAVQSDPAAAERFLREQKLPAIRSVQEPVYYATSVQRVSGTVDGAQGPFRSGHPEARSGADSDQPVLVSTLLGRRQLGLQFLLFSCRSGGAAIRELAGSA